MLFQRVSLHDWIQGVSPPKKTAATVPINYEFAWQGVKLFWTLVQM